MSKYRQAARIDSNQPEIVSALKDIPGVSVQVGMDDILVGHKGKNYWFEIKEPGRIRKTGLPGKSCIEDSQLNLLEKWCGHYEVVWTLDQILSAIGITPS